MEIRPDGKVALVTAASKGIGERLAQSLHTKWLGEPDHIGNLAVFLASDAVSWVTGETYVIVGGAGVRSLV